jgi:hypothetical protein
VTPTDKTELHWIACITAIAKDEDQASFALSCSVTSRRA